MPPETFPPTLPEQSLAPIPISPMKTLNHWNLQFLAILIGAAGQEETNYVLDPNVHRSGLFDKSYAFKSHFLK